MPVLPLVASTTVCPGFSVPLRSAASMMLRASRSLTEAAGLKASALTYMRTPFGARLLTRIHGVSPTVSSTLSKRRPRPLVVLTRELGGMDSPWWVLRRRGCPSRPRMRLEEALEQREQGLEPPAVGRSEQREAVEARLVQDRL